MRAKISFIVILISLFAISESSFGQQWGPGTGNNIHNLNTNGNVGIGTINPLQLLHIEGTNPTIRISNGTIDWDIEHNSSSLNFKYKIVEYQAIYYQNMFSISNTGMLKAFGYKNGGNQLLFSDNDGSFLTITPGSNGDILRISNGGVPEWTTLSLPEVTWNYDKNGNTTLVHSKGNVGVGTDSPQEKLHVFKHLEKVNQLDFSSIRIETTKDDWNSLLGTTSRFWDIQTRENGLFLNTNTKENPNSSDFMYVFGRTGNLGIGTETPSKALHIKNENPIIRLEKSTGEYSAWDIDFDNSTSLNLKYGKEEGHSTENLFTFTKEGRLGIGTDAPKQELHVAGDMIVGGGNKNWDKNSEFIKIKARYTNWKISLENKETDPGFYIGKNNNKNFLFIGDNKKVGIGTHTPSVRLEVVDNSSSWATSIYNSNGNGSGLKIKSGYHSTGGTILQLEDVESQVIFKVQSDGKVGIGTVNPATKLEVNGDVTAEKFFGEFVGAGASQWEDVGNGIFYSSNVGIGTETPYQPVHIKTETPTIRLEKSTGEYSAWDINFDNSSSLSFKYGNAGPTENLFTFTDRGRLGIGTNAPEQELHVVGDMVVGGGNEQSDGGSEYIKFEGKYSDWFVALENKDNGTNQPGFYIGKSGNKDFFYIGDNKNVGIGTTNPSARLTVNGKILAEEIEVIENVPSSDYVFEDNYLLLNLKELEKYIKEKKHLPEVSSAKEFKENGYNMNDFDDLLLRKIEELTLYIIEQNKRIEVLEAKNHK